MFDERAHQRIDIVEKKLDEHFSHITKLESTIAKNTSSLEENTKLTKEIAANTGELVELFRGAKAFRQFIFWLSPAIVIVIAIWHWWDDIS